MKQVFEKNKNFRQFVICEQHVTIIRYYHQFTWYISRTTCTQLHVCSIISIDSRPRVLCVRNRLDCQNFLPFFKHHRVFSFSMLLDSNIQVFSFTFRSIVVLLTYVYLQCDKLENGIELVGEFFPWRIALLSRRGNVLSDFGLYE